MILAGRTQALTDEIIAAAVDKKELPAMEPGAMCYMMSKQGYGGDSVEHWPPHLMFYFSQTDPAIWGAGLPGSPILAFSDTREHVTQFVIPTLKWSDGTEDLPATSRTSYEQGNGLNPNRHRADSSTRLAQTVT